MNEVTLRSNDFTGLGFNVQGNMRDGIFVKDVLHRGPAFQSGKVNTGKSKKAKIYLTLAPRSLGYNKKAGSKLR